MYRVEIHVANATLCVASFVACATLSPFPQGSGHEAGDHRNTRGIRLGPRHQSGGRAHLPDRRLHLRQRRARRRAVQSRGRGFQVHAHRQPHHLRARAARRGARGGRGGAQRRLGTDGALLRGTQRDADGPQYRLRAAALRHDLYAVRAYPAEPRGHGAIRDVGPGRRHRGADRREHARDFLRDRGQSGRQCLRSRGARGRGASARHAAHRRQHGGHSHPGAPGRARRGRRHPFAHEVHGRATARRSAASSSTAAPFRGRSMRHAFRCSPSRTRPITGWCTPSITARPPSSAAAAASTSAPWVPCSPR